MERRKQECSCARDWRGIRYYLQISRPRGCNEMKKEGVLFSFAIFMILFSETIVEIILC